MSNEQPAANGAEPTVAATARSIVSIMLPRFWSAQPSGWFRSVKAQFMVRNVISGRKRVCEH
jgi:hypothetical protein